MTEQIIPMESQEKSASSSTETEIPEPTEFIKKQHAETWREWWPGGIGFDRGNSLSGCATKAFMAKDYEQASKKLNEFFGRSLGLLLAQVQPLPPDSEGFVGYLALYTKTVDPEEMERFNRVEEKVRRMIEEEDAQAEMLKAAQEEAAKKAAKEADEKEKARLKEEARYIDLGKRCEKFHEKEQGSGKKKGKGK